MAMSGAPSDGALRRADAVAAAAGVLARHARSRCAPHAEGADAPSVPPATAAWRLAHDKARVA
jgi:hypothetical protein